MCRMAIVYIVWSFYGDLLSGSYVPQYASVVYGSNKFIAA